VRALGVGFVVASGTEAVEDVVGVEAVVAAEEDVDVVTRMAISHGYQSLN